MRIGSLELPYHSGCLLEHTRCIPGIISGKLVSVKAERFSHICGNQSKIALTLKQRFSSGGFQYFSDIHKDFFALLDTQELNIVLLFFHGGHSLSTTCRHLTKLIKPWLKKN